MKEEKLNLGLFPMKHKTNKIITRRPNGSVRVQIDVDLEREPSLTQQQHKDACDVNKIIAKYKTTGEFNHRSRGNPVYADVSKVGDYHSMLNTIMEANQGFMTLPSEIRLRFKNDPGLLLEFMQDPQNYDEGVKLGLYEPKKPSEPSFPETTTNKTTTNPKPDGKSDPQGSKT